MATVKPGQEMKLLLVGKTGAGKSSTANSILGEPKFEARFSMSSVTMETQYAELCRFGRHLVVIDTPGFYDTHRDNHYITTEIMRICGFLTSGFHALLYVISSTERFSDESIKTKNLFLKLFGESVKNHTIILITHSDSLESDHSGRQRFLQTGSPEFQDFLELFNRRVFFINNKADKGDIDSQVKELFLDIDDLVSQNDGGCFSTFHMKMVRAFTRLEKNKRKKNTNNARRLLFIKARDRLGLKDEIIWNTQTNAPAIYRPSASKTYNPPQQARFVRRTSGVPSSAKKIKPKSVPRISSEPTLHRLGDRISNKSLTRSVAFGSAEDSVRSTKRDVIKPSSGKMTATDAKDASEVGERKQESNDTKMSKHDNNADDNKIADDEDSDVDDTSAMDAGTLNILKEELDGDVQHHKASDEVVSVLELDADLRKEMKNKNFFDEFADFFKDLFFVLINK